MGVPLAHFEMPVPEQFGEVAQWRSRLTQTVCIGVPQVMEMEILEPSSTHGGNKPVCVYVRVSPARFRTTRPVASFSEAKPPRKRKIRMARIARSFKGTCTGSPFFVIGTVTTRAFQFTFSHTKFLYMELRLRPVFIAKSILGSCSLQAELARIVSRSCFSSSSVRNRTRRAGFSHSRLQLVSVW